MTTEALGHRHECALCRAVTECVDPHCTPPYLCQGCFDSGARLLVKATENCSSIIGVQMRMQRESVCLAYQALSSIQEIVSLTLSELDKCRSLWDNEKA